MARADIEAKLAAAETHRREAEERLRRQAERLQELEEEREALLGSSVLARQTLADLDEYRQRLQQELAAAKVEELRIAFAEAVAARDQALENASLAVAEVAAAFKRLEAARTELVESHGRLRNAAPDTPRSLPPEQTDFRGHWSAIAPLVEQELGRRLDYELVEAAARSPNRLAFESLPEHLRDLAKQRRREVHQRAERSP